MTRVLQSERKEPVSGTTRSVVVFLHGYGANGADLLGLADPLGEHMPDTLFIAPDAPEDEARRSMDAAIEDLNAFLDALMVDEDILPEQLALFGFSQGTMMSLHVGPRREDALAGIVGFSGRLLEPDLLVDEVKTKPPVLLVHGDQDEVVPPQSLSEAAVGLQKAGFKEVFANVMKGTGHGIAPDGLSVALAFMRDKLNF